jgi:hypothetical protein
METHKNVSVPISADLPTILNLLWLSSALQANPYMFTIQYHLPIYFDNIIICLIETVWLKMLSIKQSALAGW